MFALVFGFQLLNVCIHYRSVYVATLIHEEKQRRPAETFPHLCPLGSARPEQTGAGPPPPPPLLSHKGFTHMQSHRCTHSHCVKEVHTQ